MSARQFCHIMLSPMPGDVVEVFDDADDGAMLRVLAVVEDHVGFKEYGVGRRWTHINYWRKRLSEAKVGKVIRPGDHDMPF
jgi:hypothetical protein